MNIPFYGDIIERFFKEALEPVLHVYVYDGYTTLANHLKAPLGLAVILYITLLGISISQGWVKLSMGNFVKSAFKIGLIYTFAMNWGIFSSWVMGGIQAGSGQIADWVITATPIHLPQFAGTGIDGAMQSVMIEFTKLAIWVWDEGSLMNLGPLVTGGLIGIFGYALLLVGLFEIVLAKLMLAILFTLAPLFISFTLFKPTHSYFDRWLGYVVGFAFLQIFVSAVFALTLSFAQWAIGSSVLAHATNIRLMGFIPAMIVGVLGVGLILKTAHMAQAIGGAVCTSSGSQLLAGTIGGFIGGSMSALNVGRNAFNLGKNAINGARAFNGGINKLGQGLGQATVSAGSTLGKAGVATVKAIQNQLRGSKAS